VEEAEEMKIVFWGTPDFAVPPLRALDEEGFDVVAVVTQPDRPAGRGREARPSAVKQLAREIGAPVLQPERISDPGFIRELRALDPDISVVVAYGQLLPQEVLDLPRHGSINIHASLLPELRGAAPVQWAIIRGHDRSGVSIMRMEKGLDSGPVLYRVEEPIRPDESAAELAFRLSEIGSESLVEVLALLEGNAVSEEPQDHDRATYAPKLSREDARIDWTRPAEEIARRIRGMDDTPGAWSQLDGQPVKLFRPVVEARQGKPGTVLEADPSEGVVIAAGTGAVRVREVQPPGKRRMEAAAWVRGRGVSEGQRFDAE
jgi:methionyl-tRNA formyltransferase